MQLPPALGSVGERSGQYDPDSTRSGVSRNRIEQDIYRAISMLVAGALDQAHIAFLRECQMRIGLADVAISSTELIALLGDEDRHLRSPGEHLLQMANLIAGAMQYYQHDRWQTYRQSGQKVPDIRQTFATRRPNRHDEWRPFLFAGCCR